MPWRTGFKGNCKVVISIYALVNFGSNLMRKWRCISRKFLWTKLVVSCVVIENIYIVLHIFTGSSKTRKKVVSNIFADKKLFSRSKNCNVFVHSLYHDSQEWKLGWDCWGLISIVDSGHVHERLPQVCCCPLCAARLCPSRYAHLEGWFPGHVVEVYALSGGGLFVNKMISSCVFLSIFKVHMFFWEVAFLKISQFHWYTNTSPQIFSSFMHLVVDPPPNNFHCTVLYNNNRGACLRVGRIWAFRA